MPVAGPAGVTLVLAFLGGVALLVLSGWPAALLDRSYEDLDVYRMGVHAWWRGDDIYGPLPETTAGVHLPFLYPPFAVLALGPLAPLPWPVAVGTLFTLNIACIVGVLYVVLRSAVPRLTPRRTLAIAAAAVPFALLLEPIESTFGYGQINLLLMALVAVDCLAREPKWPRGIGVGLAAAVKLTPAAFVLFFLVRRDYRSAAIATVTGIAATSIGFVIDFSASVRYWFDGFEMMSWLSGTPYFTNQSIEGSIARYDLAEPLHTTIWLTLVAVLLAVVVLAMRRSGPAVALLLNAAFALLASPTSWSHHWVWAAPAIAVMATYAVIQLRRARPMAVPLCAITAATASLFYLAPFQPLPHAGNAELDWTPWQQLLGNSYTWFAAALILGYAATLLVTSRRQNRILPAATSSGYDR